MTNPVDKGLEETIESAMKDFNKVFNNDCLGETLGWEVVNRLKIKDFLKSSLTLAFTRGRESVKSLDKK